MTTSFQKAREDRIIFTIRFLPARSVILQRAIRTFLNGIRILREYPN